MLHIVLPCAEFYQKAAQWTHPPISPSITERHRNSLDIPLIPQIRLHLHYYHERAFGPSTILLKLDAWNVGLRQTGHKSLWKLQTCRR